MKFAFLQRCSLENTVWVEAETEAEAWAKALDETIRDPFTKQTDSHYPRKPIYRRLPEQDEFDL